MANYLDQIPKQLAARRKACAAARGKPALLPSCWAIIRTIANNINEYNRNAVIGGCTFPDRPVYLSPDDSSFLNLGATISILRGDTAWIMAEKAGQPPPDLESISLTPEQESEVGRRMAILFKTFGVNHHATRVYSLEPWLQDMYRDRLDVDFAEDLQRQIDAVNAYMDSVPKLLQATGLPAKLAKGVMDAFSLFKTITGSSHQLDREKMSFIDRRSYVNTIQKIEKIMAVADQSLGAAAMAGKSVIRELFELWKDANYEMMKLTRQLRVLWAGTSLDDRITELVDLLGALQKAGGRCMEESRTPMPQLPVARIDDKPPKMDRQLIIDTFHSVIQHDFILEPNPGLLGREVRRYGPLSVVIVPGGGTPRYCSEIRKLGSKDEEGKRIKKAPTERESDFDRRLRYPLNCIVVPTAAEPGTLLEDMADAWLEFNHVAFGVPFNELADLVKSASPEAFLPPEGKEAKDLPPHHARQTIAGLTAAFVRWSMCGQQPEEGTMPGFAGFKALALSRLDYSKYVVPNRYKPFLELFGDSSPKRRTGMWKRCLGPRYALDRQLVAVTVLQKDWKALKDSLKYLPMSLTANDNNLINGFAKSKDLSDPFAGHKAIALFRKFLAEQPDLKSALATVESNVSVEVETLRSQSESLGRVFQYDQASATMMARQASQIQEKRNEANRHIDQYLTGMMYAIDGNNEAASVALSMCLTPCDEHQSDDIPPAPIPEAVTEAWVEERMKPLEGKFEKRKVSGEDSMGTICYDFAYYNLGLVYLRMNRLIEARMCFKGVTESTEPDKAHLVREWAGRHAKEAKIMMAPPAEAPEGK